jgi:LysM repeat protein
MDTISRENNSMLPVAGIVVGVLALLVGAYAAVTVSKVNKSIAALEEKVAKIDSVEVQATTAAATADKANKQLGEYARQIQDNFNQVGNALAKLTEDVTKLQESRKSPTAAGGKKPAGEPAVAGPGEYVVKPGDTSGAKIARDHGVSLPDLMAVNPGTDWTKLKVGDKLKIPQKK